MEESQLLEVAPPPARRRRAPLAVGIGAAALALAGVSLLRAGRVDGSAASALSAAEYDDDVDGVYDCENGVPSVPSDYSDGSWGTIDGDWYVIAANLDKDSSSVGPCVRMTFELAGDGDRTMDQSMIYFDDDSGSKTYYYWNITGWQTDDDDAPKWKSVDDAMYDDFWATVFAVGTYNGKRWFGWYYCGPAVDVTKKGVPFILYESYDYDDEFEAVAYDAANDAGLLEAGDLKYYSQGSYCDYNWHHTANENGNEWV